ncbi:MAG: Hsp20/alpha crystallin family protein [Planctomycetota bacterium]|jgi:HSP20 family molecular chaperone IbpA
MSGELTRPNTDPGSETDVPQPEGSPVERFVFTPPIDIYETDDGLILHADLPGVTLDTLELQVQNNRLTLFGRVPDSVPDGARLVHQEYREGDYLRSFILSDNVDHDRITAKLTGGVLEVFLPHSPKAEPRRIQVSGS